MKRLLITHFVCHTNRCHVSLQYDKLEKLQSYLELLSMKLAGDGGLVGLRRR
jgi:hypothetical protein